jgi:hypothetical protein
MILAFSHLHDELKYGNEGGEETMLNVSTHTIAKIMWTYQNEVKYNTVISCKKIKTLREILHWYVSTLQIYGDFFFIFQTTICINKQTFHVTFACDMMI